MQIRRDWLLSLSLLACCTVVGCMSNNTLSVTDTAQLPPMQVRSMETREYEGHTTKEALKVVLNVLQDDGFIVDYGNTELGILHASKRIGQTAVPIVRSPNGDPLPVTDNSSSSPFSFNRVSGLGTLEATANVSEFGDHIRIRMNFQQTISPANGFSTTAGTVSNAKFYQAFFARLERGLFIQKQGL